MVLKIIATLLVSVVIGIFFIIINDLIKKRKKSSRYRKIPAKKKKRKLQPKVAVRKEKSLSPIEKISEEEVLADISPKKENKNKSIEEHLIETTLSIDSTEKMTQKEKVVFPEVKAFLDGKLPSVTEIHYTWSCRVPRGIVCPVICTESLEITRKRNEENEKTSHSEKVAAEQEVILLEENYPPFSHQRLLDMGLSDEEAKEFVGELIPQIEEQLPLLEDALEKEDFQTMERITHSLKGASTNIGTGGVADVLVEYNAYLQESKNKAVLKQYLDILKTHLLQLKERYGL